MIVQRSSQSQSQSHPQPAPQSQPQPHPHPSPADIVEVRAAQRTFEGAYMRTSLSLLSFALVVLKIFTREFYRIGALFAAYGAGVFIIAIVRRKRCNKTNDSSSSSSEQTFRTSGNVVVMLSGLSLAAYVVLLVLIARL
ncbi:cysteine protease [Ascosphaera pollenicola]|nr:cysteine protease [Ascosphaera pollenicola]